MTLHITSRSVRHRFITILCEPFVVVVAFIAVLSASGQLLGGPELSKIVLAFLLSIPTLLVVALSANAEPVTYVPRSILTSQAAGAGQFIRSGFGLLLGAVVVSLSTIAVQADLSGGVTNGSQIGELIVFIGTAIVEIGVTLAVWRFSFQLFVTYPEGRRKAIRRIAASLIIWSGLRQALRCLHAPYFKRWQHFLAADGWLWTAMISAPLAVVICATLIGQFFQGGRG